MIDKEKIEVTWKKGKLVKRDENDICDLSFEKKDISLKYILSRNPTKKLEVSTT